MNDETNSLPFFINTKRLQRDDTYFEIGRANDKLRKFIEDRRNANNASAASNTVEEDEEEEIDEEYGSFGYYGMKNVIELEDDDDKDSLYGGEDEHLDESDEDVQFDKTRTESNREEDVECQQNEDLCSQQELCKLLIEPSYPALHDPRVKDDVLVYGDVNYLIQKFRMDLAVGAVDVALFSVELASVSDSSDCSTDIQAFVVNPECGSFVWIERGRASAIFMTKSSEDYFGSILEWFRKILSDMILADSVIIAHPYYWQPNIRRRLRRVMKYLKRLYRNLARRERNIYSLSQSHPKRLEPETVELILPTAISKVVINQQPSRNLEHANSTHEKLNIMLEQLVKKWFDYQFHLSHNETANVRDLSKTYTILNPRTNTSEEMQESVTFLDFYPETRVGYQQPPDLYPNSLARVLSRKSSSRGVIAPILEAELKKDWDPDPDFNRNYQQDVDDDSRPPNLNVCPSVLGNTFEASSLDGADSDNSI